MALSEPREIFLSMFKALRHLLVCVFSLVTQWGKKMLKQLTGGIPTDLEKKIELCVFII